MLHLKTKHVRGNQMLFFDKELPKAIMTRTKLRNNFQKTKKEDNIKRFMHKKKVLCLSFKKGQKESSVTNLSFAINSFERQR